MDARPNADRHVSYTPGDYARAALKRGLGFIGATDSHTGLATAEGDNFWGKSPIDDRPENRTKEVSPGSNGFYMSASGLACIWT